MTAPTEALLGVCVVCGGPIYHLSGPSWRHDGVIRGGNHAANPDPASRAQVQEMAA
ncbi:hypothetical protein ACWKSP_22155 [Micromonosporaceae bacterium Da 78-11]